MQYELAEVQVLVIQDKPDINTYSFYFLFGTKLVIQHQHYNCYFSGSYFQVISVYKLSTHKSCFFTKSLLNCLAVTFAPYISLNNYITDPYI